MDKTTTLGEQERVIAERARARRLKGAENEEEMRIYFCYFLFISEPRGKKLRVTE
jgi:hypothetical protein